MAKTVFRYQTKLLATAAWSVFVLLHLSNAHAQLLSTHVTQKEFQESNSSPILLGHNLTPTSYTLSKTQTTVGTYAVAYGVTDFWTIGTSPWLDYAYNMPAINTRLNLLKNSEGLIVSTDVSYFKTFPYANNLFQQESLFARVIVSKMLSEFYTLHNSFGYQYFWDDTRPFSLRLISGNGDRYNTSVSTLHELRLFKNMGVLGEFGVIGLNYATQYLHWGASGYFKWSWGMVQFGLSQSRSMGAVHYVSSTEYYWYTKHAVYHPEFQLQTYL
jgi:hypothetical protein